MIIHNVEQRSPEWLELRLGKITGTRLGDVFKSDGGLGLIDELIAEQLTGRGETVYQTAAMEWGVKMEPLAKLAYMSETGEVIDDIGFIQHDTYDFLGMSPDGLVKSPSGIYHKGIEIKAPMAKTHISYLRQKQVPNDYKYQVWESFLINEEQEYHDFISFHPHVIAQPLFIYTTYRKDIQDELDKTMEGVLKFKKKWDGYLDKILF